MGRRCTRHNLYTLHPTYRTYRHGRWGDGRCQNRKQTPHVPSLSDSRRVTEPSSTSSPAPAWHSRLAASVQRVRAGGIGVIRKRGVVFVRAHIQPKPANPLLHFTEEHRQTLAPTLLQKYSLQRREREVQYNPLSPCPISDCHPSPPARALHAFEQKVKLRTVATLPPPWPLTLATAHRE